MEWTWQRKINPKGDVESLFIAKQGYAIRTNYI